MLLLVPACGLSLFLLLPACGLTLLLLVPAWDSLCSYLSLHVDSACSYLWLLGLNQSGFKRWGTSLGLVVQRQRQKVYQNGFGPHIWCKVFTCLILMQVCKQAVFSVSRLKKQGKINKLNYGVTLYCHFQQFQYTRLMLKLLFIYLGRGLQISAFLYIFLIFLRWVLKLNKSINKLGRAEPHSRFPLSFPLISPWELLSHMLHALRSYLDL